MFFVVPTAEVSMSIIVSINISERKKDRKRKIEKLGQRKKLEKLADRQIKIEIVFS